MSGFQTYLNRIHGDGHHFVRAILLVSGVFYLVNFKKMEAFDSEENGCLRVNVEDVFTDTSRRAEGKPTPQPDLIGSDSWCIDPAHVSAWTQLSS